MLINVDTACKYVNQACKVLSKKGIDHDNVDIYVSWWTPHSYCVSEGTRAEVVMGRHVLLQGFTPSRTHVAYLKSILYHEVGHAWLDTRWKRIARKDKSAWQALFGTYGKSHTYIDYWFNSKNYDAARYVSAYAQLDADEDWAETFSVWVQRTPKKRKITSVVDEKLSFISYLLDKY